MGEATWGSRVPWGSAAAGSDVAFLDTSRSTTTLGVSDTLNQCRVSANHALVSRLYSLSEGPSAGLPAGDIALQLHGRTHLAAGGMEEGNS